MEGRRDGRGGRKKGAPVKEKPRKVGERGFGEGQEEEKRWKYEILARK